MRISWYIRPLLTFVKRYTSNKKYHAVLYAYIYNIAWCYNWNLFLGVAMDHICYIYLIFLPYDYFIFSNFFLVKSVILVIFPSYDFRKTLKIWLWYMIWFRIRNTFFYQFEVVYLRLLWNAAFPAFFVLSSLNQVKLCLYIFF